MKKNKVYFLGRNQGHSIHKFFPSKIENKRKLEVEAFYSLKTIERTFSMKKADILFFRNKPEDTTDQDFNLLSRRIENVDNKLIINDINSFYNYDSKDRSFKIWQENGLSCPDFISFSNDYINNKRNEMLDRAEQFYKKYKKIIIRTNNETGSKGLHVIEKKEDLYLAINQLIIRLDKKNIKSKDTKIICVQYLETENKDNYNELYRVHILFDKVLSYYVATSKKKEFHQAEMKIDDVDKFIEANNRFEKILPKIKEKLISSITSLGNNIGAIEFFMINGEPYFIELNPMWGGAAGRTGFGNLEMRNYIQSQENELYDIIPNIYNWLDYESYYKKMYSTINDYYSDRFRK